MLAIDAALLCILFVTAVLSSSLTLLGETIRSALLLGRELTGFMTNRKALAGSLAHYEFGAGKLDQAWNLAIALAMVMAGLWLASQAIDLMVTGENHATRRGLTLAATALALITFHSGLSVLAVLRASEDRGTSEHRAHLRSRAFSFASLLVIQLTMTLAALANDASIALLADSLGATFVALLMVVGGARLFVTTVSDLIDHPLNQRNEAVIAKLLLDASVEEQELLDIRSRRSGRHIFVELTIDPVHAGSFEEARQRMIRLRRELTDGRDDLDVAIKLRRSVG
jgi:divalent metal cation (Fe/Co/Zn/Cd) transporter